YSDADCTGVSQLLRKIGRSEWSVTPRLYIVLRKIDQLQLLDSFINYGITDLWLPLSRSSLPLSLRPSLHDEFLEAQKTVLTKAVSLENPKLARHAHFGRDDEFPFKEAGRLGEGAFGYVDKVISTLSGREFARKRFRRVGRNQQSKIQLKSFKNELDVLKRIQHNHCVELIASYTDSKHFGILMAPVAECNLASFFTFATSDESSLRSLSTFFGCLASAVHYLHQTKIRHRDIKPENILVKAKRVYLTDFGISLDWENLTRSTTTEDTAKSLIYCAPEVARHEKRNSSSDIWSLGCIYLEIWTVLHGYSVEDLRDYFRARTEVHRFYSNISSFQDWMTNTLSHNPRRRPRLPFIVESWIDAMLQEPYDNRVSAEQLY
ncbi:kinase-like protein, partial [Cenococcum geophilum 1.58]|uniref:kinase-like protein n=1 Tax=Cenococcum geophilum 1.58 TaxID=794803 RepID=UPI00358FBDBC